MKGDFKNFIKRTRDARLTEDERSVLRSKILEFISFSPIRGKAPIIREKNYISIFEVRHFMKAASLVLILAVVVGGTGVSYAASNALPGEILYAVKVNINENIEETLAVTPKAKLAVQSEHIQKRLDEVQTLRKENKLSSETQKIVIAKLDEHTQEASKSIDLLREEGDVAAVLEVTSNLTPIFEANKDILQKDNTDTESATSVEKSDTNSLIAKIDDSTKVFQEQENSVIASVESEDSEAGVVTMATLAADAPVAKTGPTEEEKATKKAVSDAKEIGRQIEKIVKDRIDSAEEKIDLIKKENLEDKNAIDSANAKLEEDAKAKIEAAPVETTPGPTGTPSDLKSDLFKTLSMEAKSVTGTPSGVVEEQVVVEAPKIIFTDTYNVDAKIKEAEVMLRRAKELADQKKYKEALTVAQDVNRLASEIETHRRLRLLELSKQMTDNETLEASAATSIKN